VSIKDDWFGTVRALFEKGILGNGDMIEQYFAAEQNFLPYIAEKHKHKKKVVEATKVDLKKSLLKKIDTYSKRLHVFLEIGYWKVRKEIKITDEDEKLEDLLIIINRVETEIDAKSKNFGDEFLENVKYKEFKVFSENSKERIRIELKMREKKREIRKLAFILDS